MLTKQRCPSLVALLLSFFAVGLQGCAHPGPDMPVAGSQPQLSRTPAMKPRSADYRGALNPAEHLSSVLPGNTVVLSQPWVSTRQFELRENPIYFDPNRRASSRDWLGIPWTVSGNTVCMTRGGESKCYSAYSDATQQAFLRDDTTGLLARVTSIEPGDSRRVQQEFESRLRAREEQNEAFMMFAGLLSEALLSGMLSGGGGSGQRDRIIEMPGAPEPSYGSSMSAPPISSFYGSCHNPMGC